jgi:hypothetical protein
MVIYHLPEPASMPVPISGRFLAHTRDSRICGRSARRHQAAHQADHGAGRVLGAHQHRYAWAAVKRQSQRAEILSGHLPLVPATPRPNGNGSAIDDAELMHIAHVVGADRMPAAAVAIEAAQ